MIQEETIQIKVDESTLDNLASKIHNGHDEHIHVYVGDLSNAIAYAYLGKSLKRQDYTDKALELLSEHVDKVEEHTYGYKLGYGIPGFAWAVNNFVQNEVIEDQDFLHELDDLIIRSLEYNYESHHYDLMTGFVGKIIYLIDRFEVTKDQKFVPGIIQLVDVLEESAVEIAPDEISWLDHYTSYYSTHRPQEPYFGMGLSHGVSSILYVLAECVRLDMNAEKATGLIEKCANWVLKQEMEHKRKIPDTIYQDGEYNEINNLTWCYGTLSMCVGLYAGGKAINNSRILNYVQGLLESTIADFDVENIDFERRHGLAENIFLCHGSIGLAHIYSQFAKVFASDKFMQASEYWLRDTLEKFPNYPADKMETATRDSGILEGFAGIIVVLLDKMGHGDHGWNRIYLTDIDKF